MSLLDVLNNALDAIGPHASTELQTRVAASLNLDRIAQQPRQEVFAKPLFPPAQQPESSVGPSDYFHTGIPPHSQMQVGQYSASANAEESEPQWAKLVGILFCMPTTKIGKEEVIPHLDYFHHRSKKSVDFFCPGYVQVARDASQNASQNIISVGESSWRFDVAEYDRLRSELERLTCWQYSGESDLLLLEVRGRGMSIRLDFTTTIACNLEQMLKDGAVTSVRAFIEQIVRFGEKVNQTDVAWRLSDHLGLNSGARLVVEGILGFLPEAVRSLYKTNKHFVVRDVSRR